MTTTELTDERLTEAVSVEPPVPSNGGLSQTIRGLLGFSRALVAVFVVAQASLAALFALGGIPTPFQVVLGFIAAFTGASALIAYNDLLDVELDRERLAQEQAAEAEVASAGSDGGAGTVLDIGALLIHHPVARGVISYRLGAAYIIVLSAISMTATYLLQPWLPLIYIGVIIFVTLYSRLARRTPLKMLAVATAVTLGGVAGWMAVADPPYGEVFWLFALWTFVWEIGGRNLPNDFNDIEEDHSLGIKTLPVVYGPVVASRVSFVFLLLTVSVSVALVVAAGLPIWVALVSVGLGLYFLLEPGVRLLLAPEPSVSVRLYNRSAMYTPAMLALLAAGVLIA